mgnify:CR=1 FL=1
MILVAARGHLRNNMSEPTNGFTTVSFPGEPLFFTFTWQGSQAPLTKRKRKLDPLRASALATYKFLG